jgi:hypothetical protein
MHEVSVATPQQVFLAVGGCCCMGLRVRCKRVRFSRRDGVHVGDLCMFLRYVSSVVLNYSTFLELHVL